ncbi:MipA/OmpV family protein, partial [Shewanella sp.]
FIGQVRYAVPLNLGWGTVVPYAGVSYLSRDFTQYYFGVSKAEANKQHKDYQPGKAFTYNAGYKLIVPLSEHLELSQSSNFNYLDSAIADSPIVDGKQQWNANLALTYYF